MATKLEITSVVTGIVLSLITLVVALSMFSEAIPYITGVYKVSTIIDVDGNEIATTGSFLLDLSLNNMLLTIIGAMILLVVIYILLSPIQNSPFARGATLGESFGYSRYRFK